MERNYRSARHKTRRHIPCLLPIALPMACLAIPAHALLHTTTTTIALAISLTITMYYLIMEV